MWPDLISWLRTGRAEESWECEEESLMNSSSDWSGEESSSVSESVSSLYPIAKEEVLNGDRVSSVIREEIGLMTR